MRGMLSFLLLSLVVGAGHGFVIATAQVSGKTQFKPFIISHETFQNKIIDFEVDDFTGTSTDFTGTTTDFTGSTTDFTGTTSDFTGTTTDFTGTSTDFTGTTAEFTVETTINDQTDAPPTTTRKPIEEVDPYCNCALDTKFGMPQGWDPSQIWVDVVIILDTSEAMGDVALIDASTLIEAFFGTKDSPVLTTSKSAKFYTRVGLIAMSDHAEILYNLNLTASDSVVNKVHVKTGVKEINVVEAFDAALTMFNDGLKDRPDRLNTRQVIYYMTDSDPKIDMTPINEFKASQGIIIVNNFVENGIERPGLRELASDGYYYRDIQDNYMATIQLFCKSNCYCLPGRDAYAGLSSDPAVRASGGCLHASPVGVQFPKMRSNCANLGGGLIASIHDPKKAAFVQQLMSKSAPTVDYFWIGYSKLDDGYWRWEDQSTNPYTNWGVGEPSSASVSKCAYIDMTSSKLPWGAGNCNVGFPAVCEFAPCSVGNNVC